MRCDQYYGLNTWAIALVRKTQQIREVGQQIFGDGTIHDFDRVLDIPVARTDSIGKIEGAFEPVVADLHRYTLPNGDVFEEFVQASPWSSGPCYFIALKDGTGKIVSKSLWKRDQIDRC